MHVPQFLPYIGNEEYKAIESCFDQNWITEGPKSKEFCAKLLELTGAKYGVFAPNGTLALYLALRACGIRPGDQVIVPDFTFIGSANAVEMAGAVPVFCEVNKKNFQIDSSHAEKLIGEKTKAIMPVHIYGTAANMDDVKKIASAYNLKIIEDAAQAIGVRYKGRHTGTFGDAGCFSFFADKTITTGEGGFIVTNNESVFNNLLFLRNQGRKERGTFIHPEIGYNFRMTDIQCAIGLTQLNKLDTIMKRKQEIYFQYRDNLSSLEEIVFFEPEREADFIPFRVGILCDNAHELMDFMKGKGIEPRSFFYPMHLQPCYQKEFVEQTTVKNGQKAGGAEEIHKRDNEFSNAVYGYEHGICLPTFPSLSSEQIRFVCDSIKSFFSHS